MIRFTSRPAMRTGVLGGLPLSVGEVSGDGDDRLGNGLAQISLGVGLQLLKDHGADLLGGVVLAVDGDVVVRRPCDA